MPGSVAAAVQQYLRIVMKESTFAYLQSAAMKGYGRGFVGRGTRIGLAVLAVLERFGMHKSDE